MGPKVTALVKVPFRGLQPGMVVSRDDLKVYEVLVSDREQAIMLKDRDKKTACVMTAVEYEKHDWYTAVKGNRRKHGKG